MNRILFKRLLYSLLCLGSTCQCTFSQTKTLRYNTPIGQNCNGFYEYLPTGYADNPDKEYPLIIFLHGLGVTGDGSQGELEAVVTSGWGTPPWRTWNTTTFPTSVNVNGKQEEFILITPQFIIEPRYNNGSSNDDINAVLTYCQSHYRINPSKIYLAGQSAGAEYILNYAGSNATNANKIAGVVASSPSPSASVEKGNIISQAEIPVWMAASEIDQLYPDNPGRFYNSVLEWEADIDNATPAPIYSAKKSILYGSHSHNDAAIFLYDPNTEVDGKNAYEWLLQFENHSVVPVVFESFIIRNKENHDLLTWTTQSEVNNKGFKIERSKDGIAFSEIGFVIGKNGGGNASYEFDDVHPFSGMNYYRLGQVDRSGSINYSEVVSINNDPEFSLKVYPNPAHQFLNLAFGKSLVSGQVQIFDNSGKLVINLKVKQEGDMKIDIRGFTKGLYRGKVTTGLATYNFTFVKG